MLDHTNEPPEPSTPPDPNMPPEPDKVPQPDQDEVELPPREAQPSAKAGRRPGFRT